ncbi:MAG: hypothetical protein NT045_00305 [Candidatus Aureabacteria bacterium]|nr:hypothetical protein [Candidatus Auribacterota bacterium]
MKPDSRYEEYAYGYEKWKDDSERVEKIRRSHRGKGMTAKASGDFPGKPGFGDRKKPRRDRTFE